MMPILTVCCIVNDLVEFARFTENRWSSVYATDDTMSLVGFKEPQ